MQIKYINLIILSVKLGLNESVAENAYLLYERTEKWDNTKQDYKDNLQGKDVEGG